MAEVGVSDAIRAGIQKFGSDAGKKLTAELKAWIVSEYPHLSDKVDSTTFASTLSTLRKKAREGSEGTPQQAALPMETHQPDEEEAFAQTDEQQKKLTPQPAPTAPAPAQAAPQAAPTFDMGVFVSTVKELQRLAQKVGGKENLKSLMDLL